MKKIIIAILLIRGFLLVGASYMHYKGYDRKIVRKIYHLIKGKHESTNRETDYYAVTFNDLNKVHLSSAKKLRLKHPLKIGLIKSAAYIPTN